MRVESFIYLMTVSYKRYLSLSLRSSILVTTIVGLILTVNPIAGCAAKSTLTAQPGFQEEKQSMPVEQLVEKAGTLYNDYLEKGLTPKNAVMKVSDYLKSDQNIKEATVTGSNSIKVLFKDGNDLLILLGQSRM
jgi:hypothetical protein